MIGVALGRPAGPMKFLSRLLAATTIAYTGRKCVALRGKIEHYRLAALADCLAEAGVRRGEIWIAGNGRITFSGEIGQVLHQRLRNILHT